MLPAAEGARWIAPRDPDDPFLVLQSPFWSYNSIALASGEEVCVFDPGGRPEDVASLAEAACADGRRVTHVVVTHSHHDHIRAWDAFPGAKVWLPAAAAHKAEELKLRDLSLVEVIDERMGLRGRTPRFPTGEGVFEERASFRLGDHEVDLRFVPGHSLCTSVAFVPTARALVSADYLVSPGLPYCRWRPREFERAVARLRELCLELGIERVLPAHNDLIEGREAVLAALDEERDYFHYLREVVRELLAEGLDGPTATRRAALRMRERRTSGAGVRERQDGDNARRVVAEERAQPEPS